MYGVARNVDSSTLKTILQELAHAKENEFAKSARIEVTGVNEKPGRLGAKELEAQAGVQETSFVELEIDKEGKETDKSQLITKNKEGGRRNAISKIMSKMNGKTNKAPFTSKPKNKERK